MTQTCHWVRLQEVALVLSVVLCATFPGRAEVNQVSDPADLVGQLEARLRVYDEGQRESASWQPVLATVDALSACGESAIPIIVSALQEEKEPEPHMRALLARALAQIPGEKAARALISLYYSSPALRNSIAAGFKTGRVEKGGTMSFRLSQEEMDAFVAKIEEGDAADAWQVADVLSICTQNDLSAPVEAIAKRFVEQAQNPAPPLPSPRSSMSYLPPQVVQMHRFLNAFKAIGERAIPVLRQEKKDASDAEVDKWLTIALGSAGDPDVAPALAHIVKNDPDRYVRRVAIDAYARSARQEAIPLLEGFNDDTTTTEYGSIPLFILRSAARESLNALKSGKIE